jgi:hypothetical protein
MLSVRRRKRGQKARRKPLLTPVLIKSIRMGTRESSQFLEYQEAGT